MTAFRGALIGCGFFARNHMHGWADAEGAEIVAVCDLDRAKAEDFARSFGATPYTDAAAMLAEVRPDFVDIATTVESHRPLVELAARARRARSICQKPFARDYADGRRHGRGRRARPACRSSSTRTSAGSAPSALLRAADRRRRDRRALLRPHLASGTPSTSTPTSPTSPRPRTSRLMDIGPAPLRRRALPDGRRREARLPDPAAEPERRAARTPSPRSSATRSGAVTSVECSFFRATRPRPLPADLRPRRGHRRAPSS